MYIGNKKVIGIRQVEAILYQGASAHIRYSANADGTDFTETWSEGQNYIGIATAQTAPTEKESYVWCKFVGEAGSKIAEYSATETYDNGDIVAYNGLLYTPMTDGTTGILPTDTTKWVELVSGKQDVLPVNDGSSSHRVYVAAPQGFKDPNDNEVKYHLKRVAGYNGTGKSSSNGDIGIVTKANRDNKVAEGLISETDGAYENYIEHDELTDISIACRDKDGRLVVEDGEKNFHAVNKRQLEAAKETAKKEAANLVAPSKIATYAVGAEGATGWYRIAKTNLSGKSCSTIFKITAQCKGGSWSDLIITAAQCFDNTPQLSVLSHQRRGETAISDIRIVYDTAAVNKDGIAYSKTSSYLEVYIQKQLIQIAVAMLGDTTALADTSVNVREEWELTDIGLTETLETDFIEYKKSATDTVWADITAKSEDINTLPERIAKIEEQIRWNKAAQHNATGSGYTHLALAIDIEGEYAVFEMLVTDYSDGSYDTCYHKCSAYYANGSGFIQLLGSHDGLLWEWQDGKLIIFVPINDDDSMYRNTTVNFKLIDGDNFTVSYEPVIR